MSNIQRLIIQLQANLSSVGIEGIEVSNQQLAQLFEKREILLLQKSRIERALLRYKKNLNQVAIPNTSSFLQLKEFFPNVNIEHLKEIQSFHSNLGEILQNELKEEQAVLHKHLLSITKEIQHNEQEIERITLLPTKTAEIFNELQKLIKRQTQLQDQIRFYNTKLTVKEQQKENKERISNFLEVAVSDVTAEINSAINAYGSAIGTSNSKPPVLRLTPTTYTFGVKDNTGTGKAYTDLLLFDLAVLTLTPLPFLIHDSFLFNNIDDNTKASFLRLYADFPQKQIFISLDQYLGAKFDEIDKILYDSTRLTLSSDRPLFGKDWRTE